MGTPRHGQYTECQLLHDVPLYTQGSQDMACGWYCALMMLSALDKTFLERWWTAKNAVLPYDGNDAWSLGQTANNDRLAQWLAPWVDRWRPVPASPRGEAVLEQVIQALDDHRPSVLRLPASCFHPEGHYVVAKGYAEKANGGRVLLVNDPLVGESTLEANITLFAAPSKNTRGQVLIAQTRTWLRVNLAPRL